MNALKQRREIESKMMGIELFKWSLHVVLDDKVTFED